jgi:hypothetical protein
MGECMTRMERVYAIKISKELYDKVKSKYSRHELASLVRQYLEHLVE